MNHPELMISLSSFIIFIVLNILNIDDGLKVRKDHLFYNLNIHDSDNFKWWPDATIAISILFAILGLSMYIKDPKILTGFVTLVLLIPSTIILLYSTKNYTIDDDGKGKQEKCYFGQLKPISDDDFQIINGYKLFYLVSLIYVIYHNITSDDKYKYLQLIIGIAILYLIGIVLQFISSYIIWWLSNKDEKDDYIYIFDYIKELTRNSNYNKNVNNIKYNIFLSIGSLRILLITLLCLYIGYEYIYKEKFQIPITSLKPIGTIFVFFFIVIMFPLFFSDGCVINRTGKNTKNLEQLISCSSQIQFGTNFHFYLIAVLLFIMNFIN
jgi:hypothetical protein